MVGRRHPARRAALDRIKAAAAVEKVTVGEFIQRALGDGRTVGDCKGIDVPARPITRSPRALHEAGSAGFDFEEQGRARSSL
jgi:hypothetical protein